MLEMFQGASQFNADIGNWTVGSVVNMSGMFIGAIQFNRDLSRWDVRNVGTLSFMFCGAYQCKRDMIREWNIRSDANTTEMF
jgi:surface protein